jgi:hypothetical protein
MADFQIYLAQSDLALASYAGLATGALSSPAQLEALRQAGMAEAQQDLFSQKWRVVDQYNHAETIDYIDEFGNPAQRTATNGLSVTVFQEIEGGKKYLAIRGTNDWPDLVTDVWDIALLGSPKYQSQYRSLIAKVREWMDNGTLPSTFSVSGHSLGGFLGSALLIDLPAAVEHLYMYNAPGLGGVGVSIGSALKQIMGLATEPSLDLSRVSNINGLRGQVLQSNILNSESV